MSQLSLATTIFIVLNMLIRVYDFDHFFLLLVFKLVELILFVWMKSRDRKLWVLVSQ